ncbi:hypothetical protein [Oerskovia turbata]
MTLPATGWVPDLYRGDHLLALPRSRGVARPGIETLARAWFPEAGWVSMPTSGPAERPMAGARFRGVTPDDVRRPGVLRLTEGVEVVGPFVVVSPRAQELGVASSAAEVWAVRVAQRPRGRATVVREDRDGLGRVFAAGLPDALELRVVRWAVAVARKVAGGVAVDGARVLTPDPDAGVDLTLFSALALTPESALGVLRTVVPGARMTEVIERADRLVDVALVGETSYDGAVHVALRRVDSVPAALAAIDWRDHGPFAYRLAWAPTDPYELDVESPSGPHLIARARMRALLGRLAAMLQGRVQGVLVDDGGFVVGPAEVEARLTAEVGARFWV